MEMNISTLNTRVNLGELRTQNRDLFDYVQNVPSSYFDQQKIDCISMSCHPVHPETWCVDTKKRVEVVCIGVGYTIYEKELEVSGGDDLQYMKITDIDEYDWRMDKYKTHGVKPVKFYNYNAAQKYINEKSNSNKFFNNKHSVISEFTHNCNSRFLCFGCKTTYTDQKCVPCGNRYMCVNCHTNNVLKGDVIDTVTKSDMLIKEDIRVLHKSKYNITSNFVVHDSSKVDDENLPSAILEIYLG